MSNNLATVRAASGQSLDAAIGSLNDGLGGYDAAMTEALTLTFTSTTQTQTLTAAQFIGSFTFKASPGSPVPSGACTLNVPALNALALVLKRGAFTVINDLAQSLTVQVSGQASPVTLAAGQRSILTMDGTMVYLAVPQGAIGADGVSAGLKYLFDTSTVTTADPGTGDLRLNNAVLASVTEIALSDNSAETGNPSVEPFLAALDDSTSGVKVFLHIKKRSAPQNFAIYKVTAAGTNEVGWWRFTVAHVASSGSLSAADALSVEPYIVGDGGATGTSGSSGASALTIVRVVATTNVAVATALENGDIIDGVTLVTNELVLLTGQTAPAENGVYVVPATGAAARHASFDTYDEHPGAYFSVMEGTAKADTLWRCTSNKGGTIGTTALAISEFTSGGGGKIAQVVNTQTGAMATGTTEMPQDDTIPQNTEGTEFMTLAITPTNATSTLLIDVTFAGSIAATARSIVMGLFQDATADALAAVYVWAQTSAGLHVIHFRHKMTAGTTSATTFKLRAGSGGGAGTTTFNGVGGARYLGGVMASSITITEVLP